MKIHIFLLAAIVWLAGCVSFKTNVDQAAIPTFSRLLIISKLGTNADVPVDWFLSAFPPQYTICTLQIDKLSFLNSDSLIRQKVQECGSEVVLTIQADPYEGQYRRLGNTGMFLYMNNAANGKAFWKATSPSYYHNLTPRALAVRLKKDGIISGDIPPAH